MVVLSLITQILYKLKPMHIGVGSEGARGAAPPLKYNFTLLGAGPGQPSTNMVQRCIHLFLFRLAVINPWHTCAVRVTVLGLCVCLSVHGYLVYHAITRQTRITSDFSVPWPVKIKRRFGLDIRALFESASST